jgi:hypothetical protein
VKSLLRETNINDCLIMYTINQDSDKLSIYLGSVRVKISKQGRGRFRNGMTQFLHDCDLSNMPISLHAAPLDPSVDVNRLLEFYRSLGFRETGNYKLEFPEMRREPYENSHLQVSPST